MTLKIEKSAEAGRTVFRVSGRIGAENLQGLKTEVEGKKTGTALDLEHVTLVDVEGVRFLSACQAAGMEILHCSAYIREWMSREQEKKEEN